MFCISAWKLRFFAARFSSLAAPPLFSGFFSSPPVRGAPNDDAVAPLLPQATARSEPWRCGGRRPGGRHLGLRPPLELSHRHLKLTSASSPTGKNPLTGVLLTAKALVEIESSSEPGLDRVELAESGESDDRRALQQRVHAVNLSQSTSVNRYPFEVLQPPERCPSPHR